jgi:hypothetical protein
MVQKKFLAFQPNLVASRLSVDIIIAITELNYEKVEQCFNLIDQEFKLPVFVEFDEDAIKIWSRFVETSQQETIRPSRNEIIQQRHQMEQYMIGVSELDIATAIADKSRGVSCSR